MRRNALILIAVTTAIVLRGQKTAIRPVLSAWTVSAGRSHRADTYLSPLRYDGWNVAVGYERFQATGFDPDRWVRALNIGVEVDRTLNPVRNSTLWGTQLDGRWAMMRRYAVRPDLDLGIGGSTTLTVGALYMSRNGNNPVAATADWTVDLSGYASWRFSIGRLPVVALYRATLPVVGAFFSPDYGELYYEIYLGDRSGIVSGAWWGRYFAFDQRLTFDLRLGATSLRVGYAFDVRSTRVHDITTRRVDHAAVFGVAGEWLSLSPTRKLDSTARIVSTVY